MSQKKGLEAEKIACDYLIAQGLRWRESNYSTRMGEIDLIMQEGTCLVFVEVRARSTVLYGSALESITHAKRQKILKTAHCYLQQHKLYGRYASRFDVLTLQGTPPIIEWIKHAFDMDEVIQ